MQMMANETILDVDLDPNWLEQSYEFDRLFVQTCSIPAQHSLIHSFNSLHTIHLCHFNLWTRTMSYNVPPRICIILQIIQMIIHLHFLYFLENLMGHS